MGAKAHESNFSQDDSKDSGHDTWHTAWSSNNWRDSDDWSRDNERPWHKAKGEPPLPPVMAPSTKAKPPSHPPPSNWQVDNGSDEGSDEQEGDEEEEFMWEEAEDWEPDEDEAIEDDVELDDEGV